MELLCADIVCIEESDELIIQEETVERPQVATVAGNIVSPESERAIVSIFLKVMLCIDKHSPDP